MGYYRDIGIKCEERAYNMLMKTIKMWKIHPSSIKINSDYEYTIIWRDVRNLTNWKEFRSIMSVLNRLDEEHDEAKHDDLGYSYICIGEEYTDVECRTNDYNIDFYLVRDFSSGYDEKEIHLNIT